MVSFIIATMVWKEMGRFTVITELLVAMVVLYLTVELTDNIPIAFLCIALTYGIYFKYCRKEVIKK